MKKTYKFTYPLAIVLIALIILLTSLISNGAIQAHAASIVDDANSKQVLLELQSDENFDESQFPENSKDNSILFQNKLLNIPKKTLTLCGGSRHSQQQ